MNDKKNTKQKCSSTNTYPTPETSPTITSKQEVVEMMEVNDDETTPLKSNNILQSSSHCEETNCIQSTPQKCQKAACISTPKSLEKFSSPFKGSGNRVPIKKNLQKQFFVAEQVQNSIKDEDITGCTGTDVSSNFLLKIINKCLKDDNLKQLLDEATANLLGRCLQLVKPGIQLVEGLYWLAHCYQRREKLEQILKDKEQFEDLHFQDMINSLMENGLVLLLDDTDASIETFATILTEDEFRKIANGILGLNIRPKQNAKEEVWRFSKKRPVNSFKGQSFDQSKRVIDILKNKAGPCYKLSDLAIRSLDRLYLLMFLGINDEDFKEKTSFLVNKNVTINNASLVFRSSEEFEKYFTAHSMYKDFLASRDISDRYETTKYVYELFNKTSEVDILRYKALDWLRCYTPTYLYVKILESGIQDLKNANTKSRENYDLAVAILSDLIKSNTEFGQHQKAHWYELKALILHKLLDKPDEAAEVLLEGLQSDLSEEAKDVMRPRAEQIANRRKITLTPGRTEALKEHVSNGKLILENTFDSDHITKQHVELPENKGKKIFKIHGYDAIYFVDAENYCIYDYKINDIFTHGYHWEGQMVTTIFTLLFWDIIYYSEIEGVFLSSFQMYPLDLHTESFYRNRKTAIDNRLKYIENINMDHLIAEMKQTWDEMPENGISGVSRSVGWDKVRAVASLLGARGAAAVCRRLAAHYGHAHAGFPDLTLWDERTGQIKFVEVKTDTDKPSMKQLQWMRYLQENGISTGFCYVGACTERNQARAQARKIPAVAGPSVTDA